MCLWGSRCLAYPEFYLQIQGDFVNKASEAMSQNEKSLCLSGCNDFSKEQELITINLNGKEVEVPGGINAIEAAALHGRSSSLLLPFAPECGRKLQDVPIEMGTPMRDRATGDAILEEDGSPKVGWVPKPVIGCTAMFLPVCTSGPNRKRSRAVRRNYGISLVNHPLDCPICDQAGECRLQEFATDYGRGYSRYVERKMLSLNAPVSDPGSPG